jgi:heme oxygenase
VERTVSVSLRLREHTAESHRALEASLDMLGPQFDFTRYCESVRGFYAFLRPLLANVADAISPDLVRDIGLHRHVARLDRDMAALHLSPGEFASRAQLPIVDTDAQAWGVLYVIEGSMLGARILAPHFQSAYAIDAASGCAYFSGDLGHDDMRGLSWPQFRNLLDLSVKVDSAPAAITAAVQTFQRLQCWLERA